MFKFSNLFKHSEKYSPAIQEIHHRIDMSSEKALQEARKILLDLEEKANDSKAERLLRLGFRSVESVKQMEIFKAKRETLKMIRQTIENYRVKFPLNKFITREEANSVCEEYNLYIGDVPYFSGFVPERNLQEMERFFDSNDVTQYFKQPCTNLYMSSIEVSKEEFDNQRDGFIYYSHQPILQIMAPESQFSFTRGVKKEGRRLIDDPVVLMPVLEGYIVITAWGDEASDPVIVNQKMN